ncbi:CHAP domain-containing protein [Capnocytophaga leadbetteri]
MWRNWKDLEKKFKEERFFDVKKGIIDKKGELLVEVDTTKLKGIAPIDAIAIVKIINKNGNELGAYKDLNNTLKLYNKSVLIGLPENSSPVKAGYFKIDKIKKVQLEEEKQGHSCPRCTAPVTVAQLRELFPDVKEDTLKTVADTYTKYMKELQMDTCWNKAHFFAQAAIETGFKLHIKKGENMDYESEERLHNVFLSRFFEGEWVKDKSSGKKKFVPLVDSNAEFHDEKNRVFKSKELSQKAKQLINSKPKDQNIANFVYANINGNKNEASGDGWRFRGSGLIQLTGRGNFKMVNDKIEKLWGQSILTDSGADQVRENPELAVLTAMGYFAAKGINRIANGASSDQQIKEVCLKVGDDVDIKINNRKTKNHEEKKRFFKDKSSKTFKTNECTLNSELKIKEGIEWLLSKAITQEDVLKGVHYKVPYANDSNRTHPEGENTMDCSELVCRFLYQIEWCSVGWSGNTFILYDFAEKYSEYLTKHDDISYKPEKGDIFLWRNTNGMGHTGIVIDYDENTDVVTTIESISSKETPEGINKEIVMDGVTQLKWKRLSRHLLSHPNTNGKSTCRFYTPKEHFSKVDKKIIWKGKYVEFKIIIK